MPTPEIRTVTNMSPSRLVGGHYKTEPRESLPVVFTNWCVCSDQSDHTRSRFSSQVVKPLFWTARKSHLRGGLVSNIILLEKLFGGLAKTGPNSEIVLMSSNLDSEILRICIYLSS